MSQVKCLYCGADIAPDAEACTACGAPSHYQKKGGNRARQRRFTIYVILLTLFCLFMILYLPR